MAGTSSVYNKLTWKASVFRSLSNDPDRYQRGTQIGHDSRHHSLWMFSSQSRRSGLQFVQQIPWRYMVNLLAYLRCIRWSFHKNTCLIWSLTLDVSLRSKRDKCGTMQFTFRSRNFFCANGIMSSHSIDAEVNRSATKIGNNECLPRLDVRCDKKKIADEGFRGKADELIKELFGPVYWYVTHSLVQLVLEADYNGTS